MIEIIQRRTVPGFANNETFLNYYQYTETGVDLVLTECGYENCDPGHYWAGCKGFHVIHVVLRGRGVIQIGDAVHQVQAGEIFYIPQDRDVEYRADDDDPWEYRWVGFVGTRATATLNETVLPMAICTPVSHVESFGERLEKIYASASMGNEQGDLTALGHMYFFLAELLAECGAQGRANDVSAEYVRKATDYIREHYAGDVSVETICQSMNISRSYLYKLFKRYYGESPSGYITRFRLEKARELLSTQRYVVNEVAEMVGFSDHPYFTKRFRMAYGMSPREYGKRMYKERERE